MLSATPVCVLTQPMLKSVRVGSCQSVRTTQVQSLHRGPAVSKHLRLSRNLTVRRPTQLRAEGEQDNQPSADSEQTSDDTEDPSPATNSASATHDVLLERFQSAVDEDYADQEYLNGFIGEARTEFERLSEAATTSDIALAAVKEQFDAAQGRYLRLNADFENFRKRSATEKDAVVIKTKAGVIEDLLPVIDAFDAAASQVKADTDGEKKIAASYQGLYNKLVDAFKKLGLVVVPGLGSPFDPEVHEAIMRAPSDEVPDGTVLQEFRKGFMIGKTLLRPAMVQVSFSDVVPAAPAPAAEDDVIDTTATGEEPSVDPVADDIVEDAV